MSLYKATARGRWAAIAGGAAAPVGPPMLARYVPGDAIPAGGSFTRASTAWQRGSNGLWAQVASGAIRDAHYIDGVRHTLLEPAYTNLLAYGSTPGGSGWNNAGGVSATAGVAGAPDGTATATRLAASATSYQYTYSSVSSASGGTIFSCWVKPEGTTRWLQMRTGDGGTSLRTWFDLNGTGAVGTSEHGAGNAAIIAEPNGWFLCWIWSTAAMAGANPLLALTAANGGDSGAAGLSVLLWNPMAVRTVAYKGRLSPIPTSGTTVTRAVDSLYLPGTWTPQDAATYLDVTDLGFYSVDTARFMGVGRNYPYDFARFDLGGGNATFGVSNDTAGGGASSSAYSGWAGTAATVGKRVEFRGRWNGTNSIALYVNVDGGADVGGMPYAGPAAHATWGVQRLYPAADANGGTPNLPFAIRKLVVHPGSTTSLAQLRSA